MGNKVLVVDDEPYIADLAKVKLSHGGFEVRTANSGPEALEAAAQDVPDVVVLDVMMPGMDGWEVARRLREDPATQNVAILMLTALGVHEESMPQAVNIDEYYTKPFDGARLLKLVRKLAEGR